MEFKLGDIVRWHGAIGKIVGIYGPHLYCDFYQKSGGRFIRDMVTFVSDGTHKAYHSETSLDHASAEETEVFRRNPPNVSRGIPFGGA